MPLPPELLEEELDEELLDAPPDELEELEELDELEELEELEVSAEPPPPPPQAARLANKRSLMNAPSALLTIAIFSPLVMLLVSESYEIDTTPT